MRNTRSKRHLFPSVMGLILVIFCSLSNGAYAMTLHPDIAYANTGTRDLLLDLYLPDTATRPTLIVWLYGGGWRAGNKDNPRPLPMVERGYALASIDFRNSPQARFPAQIHDIKAALRWLRAHAGQYGYAPDKIVVWGYSSGGHLAALTGVTNEQNAYEGELGDFTGLSSAVQGIVDYSGPTNLTTILHQSTPHGLSVRIPALELLFGMNPDQAEIQDQLKFASPALQVSATSPPLLLMHGVQDNQVPINQALELEAAYAKTGLSVESHWILEAGHGIEQGFSAPYLDLVEAFIKRLP